MPKFDALEPAQAWIDSNEPKLVDLDSKLTESQNVAKEHVLSIDKLKTDAATGSAASSALQAKLVDIESQLVDVSAVKESFTKLQENHTSLETRFTSSIKDRLKNHGLNEDLYKERTLVELEAMDLALGNFKPNVNANAPGSPSGAGISGGSGSGVVTQSQNGLQNELDAIEKARKRNQI